MRRGKGGFAILASSLENIFAPLSHANASSTFGSGYTSLSMLLFSGLKVNTDANFTIFKPVQPARAWFLDIC